MEKEQKLVVFDLDGTLTPISTWEALNMRLGITPEEDRELFDRYLNDQHSYKEWIMELIAIYKKNGTVTKADLEEMAHGIVLREDAQTVVDAAKEKGYHVALVSGSVDIVARIMAARLGIGEWFATNKAVFNYDTELTDIETMGDERDAKFLLLQEFCLKNDIDLKGVIAVADGGNDLEIFKHTKGILLGDNKDLAPLAWKRVENLGEISNLI